MKKFKAAYREFIVTLAQIITSLFIVSDRGIKLGPPINLFIFLGVLKDETQGHFESFSPTITTAKKLFVIK